MRQSSPGNRTAVANLMVNENILDIIRYISFLQKKKSETSIYFCFSFVLETRCHITIRCVLNFVSEVIDNLEDGMAKITLAIKLNRKLIWIAEKKVNII